MRGLTAAAAIVALGGATSARAQQAPATSARMEIVAVGDSTVTLRRGGAPWLKPGQRGIVVDPRRRDGLVARMRLLVVEGDSAVALLTALTGPVARQHVALVEPPRARWFTSGLFWAGAALGAALGVVGGAAF